MEYLVSVIIPIYKVEKYLERCVSSIVGQIYNNLEIILVDDGSPDNCPAMCDEWASRDARIRVIHQKNGGLSAARNKGIDIAQGEFICFVDSDDYVEVTMIEDMVRAQKKHDVKLVLTNFKSINEDGTCAYDREQSPIRAGVYEAKEIFPRLYEYLNWYYVVAWNKLYHRSIFEELRFPVGRIHEDEYVISQVLWKAEKIACLEEEEYNYVFKRPGAIMAESQKIRYHFLFEALEGRHNFYLDKKLFSEAEATRHHYFGELEKLACIKVDRGGLNDMQWQQAKKRYASLRCKSRREKIYWFLFMISPKLEYYGMRMLRLIFGRLK